MDNFRNYYELLGVSPKAQGDEIKKAFRRLARQYHPDLNPGNKIAEEKFKAIGEAYEVLADPDRRARYDQFSSYWQTQRQSADVQDLGNRDPNLDNDYGQFPDFNVFVDELLGRGMASPRRPNPDPPPQSWANSPREPMDPRGPRRSSAPPPMDSPRGTPPRGTPPDDFPRGNSSRGYAPPGNPLRDNARTDPVPGGTRPRRYGPPGNPPRGYGPPPGSPSAPPPDLPLEPRPRNPSPPNPLARFQPGRTKTAHTVRASQRRDAEARLEIPLEKAYHGGIERVRLEDGRSIEVQMPAGLITGQQIRLRGQGMGGGDLYLRVVIPLHPFYTLQGSDLLCEVTVTPPEAALGKAIAVPTLDGPVQVQLPPGAKSGQKLRLAQRGYPQGNGQRGDQIVRIQVAIPEALTPEERQLYDRLYTLQSGRPEG